MTTVHKEKKISALRGGGNRQFDTARMPAACTRFMSSAYSKYTLVGFSPELDWRTISFVRPIPRNRLCGACGLVRRRTALLPCLHILCETCYEQSAEEGLHVCPLDGSECHDEDDVEWKDFPPDQLMRREVRCWNEEYGCTSVIAASDVSRHLQRECGHHSVSCPKCSAHVLCSNVCSHLRSGCEARATPPEPAAEVPLECNDDSALVSTFRAALENQAAESRRLFERLAVDTGTHGDRLSEVSHAVNILRETLKQHLAAETGQIHGDLVKNIRHITSSSEEVVNCLSRLGDAITSVPRNIERDIKAYSEEVKNCFTGLSDAITTLPKCIDKLEKTLKSDLVIETRSTNYYLSQIATSIKAEAKKNTQTIVDEIRQFIGHVQESTSIFIVRGVQELKEKVLKEGCTVYETGKVYLRGYCISPGVYLNKEGDSLILGATMALVQGDMDDFLQWPFQHNISLCVVHPKDCSKREHVQVPNASCKFFQKPAHPENTRCSLGAIIFNLDELVNGGFVENNKLLFRMELYPCYDHQ